MKQLLFLCTGNYYRSRYAELLFNTLAVARGLEWMADSRALNLAAGAGNVGPLSPHLSEALKRHSIMLPTPLRFPMQVAESDFAQADLVIALKEAEHRPLMNALHPGRADRIEYWHVHDIDQAPPSEALALIDKLIADLLARLGSPSQVEPALSHR